MVCIPCIVIPFVLWFFHKYIRPIVMKFWPWSKQESIQTDNKTTPDPTGGVKMENADKSHLNGAVTNGHAAAVMAGGGDKKTN